jgi:hypothetical protein
MQILWNVMLCRWVKSCSLLDPDDGDVNLLKPTGCFVHHQV